jgi:LemA protein
MSSQRRLVVLDENINNAMSQIGVQLSSRFDALTALLDLTKGYAKHESETLIETIKSRRSVITAKSTPDDVVRQEGIISEALGRIAMVSEQYPELKANENYIKTMDAVETFENMVRISRLVYNDSVTKLNRDIRMFPVSLIAGMLGFRQRDYLEEQSAKADMPSMK